MAFKLLKFEAPRVVRTKDVGNTMGNHNQADTFRPVGLSEVFVQVMQSVFARLNIGLLLVQFAIHNQLSDSSLRIPGHIPDIRPHTMCAVTHFLPNQGRQISLQGLQSHVLNAFLRSLGRSSSTFLHRGSYLHTCRMQLIQSYCTATQAGRRVMDENRDVSGSDILSRTVRCQGASYRVEYLDV